MNNLIDKFEHQANIQALKYVIGKQMFCKYSGKVLDYRNSIMLTTNPSGPNTQTRVIHGSFLNKLEQIKQKAEEKGVKIEVFINITAKNK